MPKLTLFAQNDRKNFSKNATIIPYAIWNQYFYNALLDVDLKLLDSEPKYILNILSDTDLDNLSVIRKQCCWLVLLSMDVELSILHVATKLLKLNIAELVKKDDGLLVKLSTSFKDSCSALEKIFQLSTIAEEEMHNIFKIYQSNFELACAEGDIHTFDSFLKSKFLSKFLGNFKFPLTLAVKNGHVQIVDKLLNCNDHRASNLPDYDMKSLLSNLSYGDVVEAYLKGNKDVLEYLLNNKFFVEIIIDKSFIVLAVHNDHSIIFDRFLELDLDVLQTMIMANDFAVFAEAVNTKKLGYIHKLIDKFPNLVDKMIPPYKYFFFDQIMKIDKDCAIRVMELSSKIFIHLDDNLYLGHEEYTEIVDIYIAKFLKDMREHNFNYKNPNDNKDLAKEGFYIARNLIIRNSPKHLEDINYLISIPKIKKLLCSAFDNVPANQLLVRALIVGNENVVDLLLHIPEVKDLAEKNNYYQSEINMRSFTFSM